MWIPTDANRSTVTNRYPSLLQIPCLQTQSGCYHNHHHHSPLEIAKLSWRLSHLFWSNLIESMLFSLVLLHIRPIDWTVDQMGSRPKEKTMHYVVVGIFDEFGFTLRHSSPNSNIRPNRRKASSSYWLHHCRRDKSVASETHVHVFVI
jgi:hypothetical protein